MMWARNEMEKSDTNRFSTSHVVFVIFIADVSSITAEFVYYIIPKLAILLKNAKKQEITRSYISIRIQYLTVQTNKTHTKRFVPNSKRFHSFTSILLFLVLFPSYQYLYIYSMVLNSNLFVSILRHVQMLRWICVYAQLITSVCVHLWVIICLTSDH